MTAGRAQVLLIGMKTTILLLAVAVSGCALTEAAVVTKTPPDAAPIIAPLPAPLAVTRIAHASALIELGELKVLTDPWFSEMAGYHHGEPLALSVDQLPKLDAVVVSHGHYDHFDIETFAQYRDKAVPMIVLKGLGEKTRAQGFTQVTELAAGDHATLGALTVTAMPGAHGADEITFLLEAHGLRVFFGGDSLLTDELREAAKKVAPVDLALPAVNGLRAMGSQKVMNAEEAAELVSLLHARVAVPTHYTFKGSWFTDTFILGYDGTPERFVAAAAKVAPETQTRVLAPGERLSIGP
jgi:L-ascorbate metabolism protein UlaG (beta-lactamase superfamily)